MKVFNTKGKEKELNMKLGKKKERKNKKLRKREIKRN